MMEPNGIAAVEVRERERWYSEPTDSVSGDAKLMERVWIWRKEREVLMRDDCEVIRIKRRDSG